MSIFPDIMTQTIYNAETDRNIDYGSEIRMDYNTGEIVIEDGEPKIFTGLEALRIWVEKALITARYRWPIYSWSYGSEITDIIGLSLNSGVTKAEIRRVVREALIYDTRIKDISNFKINKNKDKLNIEFTVNTMLNDTLEVSVSV